MNPSINGKYPTLLTMTGPTPEVIKLAMSRRIKGNAKAVRPFILRAAPSVLGEIIGAPGNS